MAENLRFASFSPRKIHRFPKGFYDGKFLRRLLAQFVNEWKQILGMELVIKLSINEIFFQSYCKKRHLDSNF